MTPVVGPLMDHFNFFPQIGSITTAAFFSTATLPTSGSTLQGRCTSSTTYTFPATVSSGNYLLYYVQKTSMNETFCQYSSSTNCNLLNLVNNNTTDAFGGSGAFYSLAQDWQNMGVFVSLTGPSATVTLTSAGTSGTVNAADLFVIQMPSGIN